jgi:SOS-response transcriptional repressor LexA
MNNVPSCPNCGHRFYGNGQQAGRYGLTAKMKELLDFVTDHRAKNAGVSPNYDQMAHALSLKSKSGVHRIMKSLVERGHITAMPRRARSVVPAEASP